MQEGQIFSKILILLEQGKFNEAELILKDLLSKDPDNVTYLSIYGELKIQQEEYEIADELINTCIGLTPNDPNLFYQKARLSLAQEKISDAENYLNQAVNLNPYDADYHALLASIHLLRKNYQLALQVADQALEIDAENLHALNNRSIALTKLNRKEESYETTEGALRGDPNNPYTHANYGWGLLEKGDHKKALTHFQEALKNDPNMEFAQAGMLEAIKATNPIYKVFLKYSFWMTNMTSKYQWGVIIGFYIVFRLIRGATVAMSGLRPFLVPVLVLLYILAFSTWIIPPISNLFLRFNKYGKMLLSKPEKWSSNLVALSLIILLVGLIPYLIFKDERFIAIGAYGLGMMIPLSVVLRPSDKKILLYGYVIGLAVVGLIAIGTTFSTGELFNPFSSFFLIGLFAFQWIVNFLLIKEHEYE